MVSAMERYRAAFAALCAASLGEDDAAISNAENAEMEAARERARYVDPDGIVHVTALERHVTHPKRRGRYRFYDLGWFDHGGRRFVIHDDDESLIDDDARSKAFGGNGGIARNAAYLHAELECPSFHPIRLYWEGDRTPERFEAKTDG